ncbi:TonB-dependent receptor [Pedobacter sp. ISL-68]|uniref:TonB-dependent receptor n=1 Tax=unclassified Pedobacter TaxID=2628915 RepID=UPI001BE533A1|nr:MULTISPECIES: TonB-dependent receptor [unclassified Pedobacter]MBT2564009.1 TonB-dependent receptor [Pedobacter sp. ISL-64]MBT2592584.1 TonB-dependent receptor [Pedobacter sp. ISL-68]
MKSIKYIYSSLFILAAGLMTAQAQDKKADEKAVVNEEIEVVRPYKPILAEAVKLRRSPNLDDVKTYKAKLNYSILDRKLELNSDIQKLQAQALAEEKESILVNNYVKGAFGSLATLLGEAYFNTGKDEGLQVGGYFKHFSQEGKLNKQNSSNQQLSVFGRSILDQNTVSGRINFERNGTYFYGIDDTRPTLNPNPDKQALTTIELEGELVKNFTEDEDAFSYALKANGYIWNDKFSAKENYLSLNGYVNKRINSLNLGLAASTEFGNSKDALTSVGNNLLRLNPYIRLQVKGAKITAGINFVQEFGAFSSSKIFPAITADFTLIPDYLQVFGEVKGDVNRNSLKGFTDENPWLNSNIVVKNTVEKLSFSAGIKGTGGPGFGYKARVYVKQFDDMPLFVNNFTDFNKFDVIYDFGKTKLTGLEGEISVQVSDALKWTGKLNIDDWKPASETYSWFKPGLKVSSNFVYTYNKKLSFNAGVVIQDDIKAKVYTGAPVPASQYIIPNTNIELIETVKGYVDLGLGADYRINKKFSVFAKANNILNTNYSRYLYYQVNGFNIFGGLTYSF